MTIDSIEDCMQSLKTAQVVEDLVRYLKQLLTLTCGNSSEAHQIADGLLTIWEKGGDNFILSSNWRMLAIQVARAHVLSAQHVGAFSMYITFSSKVFKSFGRLTATLESTEFDLQPEEANLVLQKLQMEAFGLASAIFSLLEDYPCLLEMPFLCGVKDCICESLDLLKAVLQNQNFESSGAENQKCFSEVLSSIVNVLHNFVRKMHHQPVESRDKGSGLCQGSTTDIFCIVSSGIHKLVELGKAAATRGRNLVGVLNISWKGVTSLLQVETKCEETLNMLNVAGIIDALMSCAVQSLQHAVETWFLSIANNILFTSSTEAEFKKLCIPVKFFLINAIRIASIHPHQTAKVGKSIICCLTRVTAYRFALSTEKSKVAAEGLAEIVEPISCVLLHSLLSSAVLHIDTKVQLLEYLIEGDDEEIPYIDVCPGTVNQTSSFKIGILKLGRMALFLNILQVPSDFGKEMAFQLSKRLDWLMNTIANSTVYAMILEPHLQLIVRMDSSSKLTWKLLYVTILSAFETFTICVVSTEAWNEVEAFLFRNVLHPHVLCRQLILDLWCFIARHAHMDLLKKHISGLFSLLKDLSCSMNAISLCWPLKSIARLICCLVKTDAEALASELHVLAFDENTLMCPSSTVAAKALITESFPLVALPKDRQRLLIFAIVKPVLGVLSDLAENVYSLGYVSSKIPSMVEAIYCLPEIHTHCSGEFGFQQSDIQNLVKSLSYTVEAHMEATPRSNRIYSGRFISELLRIISRILEKLCSEDANKILVSLHHFFKMEPWSIRNDEGKAIKPILAEFLASLSGLSLPEDESSPVSQAIWELYHLVLREQHWALVHIGLASFGYFAAHTSCSELWRFVPPDAALAFCTDGCSEANEETFMSALRVFLEKEEALSSLVLSDEELPLLHSEGLMLTKSLHSFSNPDKQAVISEDLMDVESKSLESVQHVTNSEMEQALQMLHGGIALLKEKLPQWLKDLGYSSGEQLQICERLSVLADIFGHLSTLHPFRAAALNNPF